MAGAVEANESWRTYSAESALATRLEPVRLDKGFV